jgi:hypothetical protein
MFSVFGVHLVLAHGPGRHEHLAQVVVFPALEAEGRNDGTGGNQHADGIVDGRLSPMMRFSPMKSWTCCSKRFFSSSGREW